MILSVADKLLLSEVFPNGTPYLPAGDTEVAFWGTPRTLTEDYLTTLIVMKVIASGPSLKTKSKILKSGVKGNLLLNTW